MKSVKKILCVLLTLTMVVSCVTVGSIQSSAVLDESAVGESQSGLAQDTVQGSAILHCFCWSYNTIKQKLPEIAAAGYTAIQTSPVQPPKDYDASNTNIKDNWWKLYQPLDLAVSDGNNSWLGTKSELTSMCSEAESYGIKVIVDIVSNHLANNGTNDGSYNSLHSNVNSVFKNQQYFYVDSNGNSFGKTSSSSRYQMTHGHLGMPELNTSTEFIQTKVLNLMKECVDCGVDGFRFDTAKHIELPSDDDQTKSNFWPTVINGINSYKSGLYIYGEILGDAYSKAINKNYVQYMDLTDDYTCYLARDAVRNRDANTLHASYYQKGIAADQAVLWAESHDTYMNDDGNSKDDSNDTIVKTWAMINSRADATSLFFVRPGDMGTSGTDITWKSTAVVESNKFKNIFDGQSEYLSYNSSYKAAYNERGTKGMVIVKTDGAGEVKLSVNKLADGTYLDHITNENFTVSKGVITGTVDSSGVAVIYNANDTQEPSITAETLYMKPERESWRQNNERYAMYVYNNQAGEWVSMTDSNSDGIYEASVPAGAWKGVIFCRMNRSIPANRWNEKTDTDETKPVWNQTVDLFPTGTNNLFTVTDKDTNDNTKYTGTWSFFDGITDDTPDTVSFDNTLYLDYSKCIYEGDNWWAEDDALSYAYFFYGNTNTWVKMDPVENETSVCKVTIPSGNWTNVIFTRMNPDGIDTAQNKWDNKWNQTEDLILSQTNSGNNCFIMNNDVGVDKITGSWEDSPKSHTHSYTETSCVWSENNTKATVTLSCECGKTLTFEKSATTVSDADKDEYTTTVRYQGEDYPETKTVYKRPTFEGFKVKEDGKIGIFFYVDYHQFNSSGEMSFTRGTKSSSETLEETESPSVKRAACYVAAKEMGDPITASVIASDNSVTNNSTYTVKQYLERIIKNEDGEAESGSPEKTVALQTLARSMLNYGAKAQLQFNYKANEYELVDYGLDSYSPETTNGVKFEGEKIIGNTGLTYAGSSMLLEDTITYRVFFKAADKTNLPVVQYNDETLTKGEKGGYIYYDIKGIKAPELLNDRNLNIGDTGFTVNPQNYIYNALHNTKNTDEIKNLVTALYDYYKKAYAYFILT